MSYLIDGHNLIPKLPGLSLKALDDEQQLIQWLQEFCRKRQKNVEVFFDGAPPGEAVRRRYGRVTAHFVSRTSSADQAIRAHLARLGRAAQNWTVVTSDLAVQASARQARAQVLSSEAFADQLRAALQETKEDTGGKPEGKLSDEQVQEWLRLFGSRGDQEGK